jgi:hypothetical protein
MPLEKPDDLVCLSFQAERFKQLFVEKNNNITNPSFKNDANKIYRRNYDTGVIDSNISNDAIRKILSKNALTNLYNISADLTACVWEDIEKIRSWIVEKMYGIEDLRSIMLKENEKDLEIKLLEKSFETLIVTLGEPMVQMFLRHPRSENIRGKILRSLEAELRLVSSFYEKDFIKNFIWPGNRASNTEFDIREMYVENFPKKTENSKPNTQKVEKESLKIDININEDQIESKKDNKRHKQGFFKQKKSDSSLNDNQLETVSIKSNDKTKKEFEIHQENEINKNNGTFDEVLKEIEEDIQAFKLCNHTSYNNKLILF